MTPEAIQAVEAFVSVWANPIAAHTLRRHLADDESATLSALLAEMGEQEIAKQWLN